MRVRLAVPSTPSSGMRIGQARAHAAVGILNATATGVGCSLAVAGGVEAEWEWTDAPGLRFGGPCDDRLAQSVLAQARRRLGASWGATVRTASTFPPGRGLKTSSGAAAALVLAAHEAGGAALDREDAILPAISASEAAGVTLTGAFDDQVAAVHGGCPLTDNRARRVLRQLPVEPWHVAVWVPEAHVPKSAVAGIDASAIASHALEATRLAGEGKVAQALTCSGAAFTRLYAAHGLPVTQAPADVALAHGALGAGLSGTGPAVAALFDRPARLPEVPGGTWSWHRAVERVVE